MKPFGQGEKQQLQKGKKKSWLGSFKEVWSNIYEGQPLLTLLLGEDCSAFYIYSHLAIFVRAQKLHL
jgi:hypothetical protein